MLQSICEHLNNYFIESRESGEFTADASMISPAPDLKEGQRFWLVGSSLNGGVYTYHEAGIKDDDDKEAVTLNTETFSGTICAMAVPLSVVLLADKITDWLDKYGDAVNSPYQSENVIGVYSYTKANGGGSGGSGGSGGNNAGWQSQFASELKRWRKICL